MADMVVVVRPGDKLIYATPNQLSRQQADEVARQLAARLPDVDIVVASGRSGLAVYRDEPTGIRKVSRVLDEEEIQALRDQGVIG